MKIEKRTPGIKIILTYAIWSASSTCWAGGGVGVLAGNASVEASVEQLDGFNLGTAWDEDGTLADITSGGPFSLPYSATTGQSSASGYTYWPDPDGNPVIDSAEFDSAGSSQSYASLVAASTASGAGAAMALDFQANLQTSLPDIPAGSEILPAPGMGATGTLSGNAMVTTIGYGTMTFSPNIVLTANDTYPTYSNIYTASATLTNGTTTINWFRSGSLDDTGGGVIDTFYVAASAYTLSASLQADFGVGSISGQQNANADIELQTGVYCDTSTLQWQDGAGGDMSSPANWGLTGILTGNNYNNGIPDGPISFGSVEFAVPGAYTVTSIYSTSFQSLTVSSGNVTFSSGNWAVSGSVIVNSATINFGSTVLDVDPASTAYGHVGSVQLSGGTIVAATINIASDGSVTGNGVLQGNVISDGTLSATVGVTNNAALAHNVITNSVAFPGIEITGNLTLGPDSQLVIDVVGEDIQNPLLVDGSFTAGGELVVNFVDGFAPVQGDIFQLLPAGFLGEFTSVDIEGLLPGFEYSLDSSDGLALTALNDGQPVPEPGVAAVLGGLFVLGRRRKIS